MASEAGLSEKTSLLHSVNHIQQESKLVRSASDSSQLALCWAEGKSRSASSKSTSTAVTPQASGNVLGSISLQELCSIVSGTLATGTATMCNFNVKSGKNNLNCNSKADFPQPDSKADFPQSDTARTTCLSAISACSKQQDIQIPSIVFEEKEMILKAKEKENKPQTTQGASVHLSSTPLDVKETRSNSENDIDEEKSFKEFFFWSPEVAKEKQVEQIGASACGATAIINVMNVLDLHPDLEIVADAVQTNLRAGDAPLPEYLFSRSIAGATHEALIQGLEKATHGCVYSRFFALYPKRKVHLKQWLVDWMRLGVVPLATLNLQAVPIGEDIHDAWHHQMIYGVDKGGIYMCNPIIMETEDSILPQLCSESVLLVRRFDVLKRWHRDTNLSSLALHEDSRWKDMDVLGQAVNMLLDDPPSKDDLEDDDSVYEKELTDWFMRCHIRIPAAYTSGITLCVRRDNQEGYRRLSEASDLPLIDGQ